MQSSMTAWLKKPAAVKQPPPAGLSPFNPAVHSLSAPTALPTPPPEEQEQHADTTHDGAAGVSPTMGPFSSFAKPSPAPLSANLSLEPCNQSTLFSFKRLNALLLPIPYPTNFYAEILSDPTTASLTLLAIWRDNPGDTSTPGRVVGGIRCRLLGADTLNAANTTTSGPQAPLLYISTLTVLSAFRKYGIATHLLDRVLLTGIDKFGVKAVGAHVWVSNEEGREWYAKRGFQEVRIEEGYYRRLKPQGAVVVKRVVGVADLLGK